VAQAFEVYTGIPSSSSETYSLEVDSPIEQGGYLAYQESENSLMVAAKENKIKKVNPKEQE
jgi:hypothetical protein